MMLAIVPGMLDPPAVQGLAVFVRVGHHVVLLTFFLGQALPGFGLQAVFLPHKPFHGGCGMVDAASPPQQGLGRNGVWEEAMPFQEGLDTVIATTFYKVVRLCFRHHQIGNVLTLHLH